jgi:hypothetical protein
MMQHLGMIDDVGVVKEGEMEIDPSVSYRSYLCGVE